MEWITEHSAELVGIISAAFALGGLIVKLTPTKKDDEWWQAIKKLFGKDD